MSHSLTDTRSLLGAFFMSKSCVVTEVHVWPAAGATMAASEAVFEKEEEEKVILEGTSNVAMCHHIL